MFCGLANCPINYGKWPIYITSAVRNSRKRKKERNLSPVQTHTGRPLHVYIYTSGLGSEDIGSNYVTFELKMILLLQKWPLEMVCFFLLNKFVNDLNGYLICKAYIAKFYDQIIRMAICMTV